MKPRLVAIVVVLLGVSVGHAESSLEKIRPFIKQYCLECHGPTKQANDLRFDRLGDDLGKRETLELWQGILDQLNAGTMPPRGKPKPDAKVVNGIIRTLTAELKPAYARMESTGGKTVIRRLNRFELRNTFRDLLCLDGAADYRPDVMVKLEDRNGDGVARWTSNDPTREFPADDLDDGFDTIGKRLVMSDFLLKKVISAAEYSLDLATVQGKKPNLDPQIITAPIRTESGHGDLHHLSHLSDNSFDGIYQRYREPGAATGGLGRVVPTKLAQTGVPIRGVYRITIEASAHNQKHPWGDLIKSRQDENMLLGLHMIDSQMGAYSDDNPKSIKLTEWEMKADGVKRTYTHDGALDVKWLPWLGWENAPYDRGLTPSKLVQKYLPDSFHLLPPNATEKDRQRFEPDMAKVLFDAGYKGPHIRIYTLKVELIDKSWPPRSHTRLYGEKGTETVEDLILAFARQAFRREVKPDEVARYVQLVKAQMDQGRTREESLRTGYTAVMVAPQFHYLRETEGPLDGYAIASRLSYFLWSSMPDEELLSLAKTGRLKESAVIHQQVDRLLDNPKSAAFVRRFTSRWLRLYKLGTMPPPGGFYYHRQMEAEMLKQTDSYFAYMIRENRPIREVIDSDYTFLNERVAQWIYQRSDVWGDGFRKTSAKSPHGGGMLTMPAIMTATANGVDTSPVVRGVWLLESILGTPPSPPPPDVEPLSPDLRGKKTIREQLEAHRIQPSCAGCHRKIDPYGFAFENFDELGLWRSNYRDGGGNRKIDPIAELPDGTLVKDVDELKGALLRKEQQVIRHLTEKLLVYGTGRRLEANDRGEVDRIIEELNANGGRMRDLLKRVATSKIFTTK